MKSFLAALLFGLALAALLLAWREYRVAQLALNDEIGRYEILIDAPPARGFSLDADEALALACDDTLRGEAAAFQTDEVLEDIAAYCRSAAERALSSAPTSALAHYLAASSAQILGDGPTLNRHLAASQGFGPFESWMAKRRFKLSLLAGADLDDAGRAAYRADIASLLLSAGGREFLGKYYAREPSIREDILALAEKDDAEVQKSLLSAISKYMDRQAGAQ